MPGRLGPAGPPGGTTDTRNLILAMVLAMAVLFGYDFFIASPANQRRAAEQRVQQAQIEAQARAPDAQANAILPRPEALAANARVAIETPSVDGSLNLTGARFDDLSLRKYRKAVSPESPEVTLLSPQRAKGAYDSYFGWEDAGSGDDLVGARTEWAMKEAGSLTPSTPLTLTFAAPSGLVFTRTISVDENYLFTIADTVQNASGEARTIRPFSVVRRHGLPEDFIASGIVHQGLTGVLGPQQLLEEVKYDKARKHAEQKAKGEKLADTPLFTAEGRGGWLGVSDHYWLTALIPDQQETIRATYDSTQTAAYVDYRVDYVGNPRAIAPGAAIHYTQRFFAGAKRVDLLQNYEKTLGAPHFDKAVDWGNFWFLTRPFFTVLDYLGKWAGNFGIGILLTTILVKLLLFPLVNQSFDMMSKMRKLQPKMKEIQERFAADKQRQQQETMALYQREKINPIAGCLPILLQIPVFFALYKTLTVTIEMRHAPFFGWIHDLSAPDPTTLFNLFGLLPYDPTAIPFIGTFLHLGVWPILYGVTMFALQSLSPPPPDPVQAQIFKFLPIIFTFLFAAQPAGLVIYWTWSNSLSILQQYVIMRRNGVETEFDKFVAKRLGKKPEGGAA